MTSTDAERDEFMHTLDEVAMDVGWQLEQMHGHPLFRAMVESHGEDQVRQWLLLQALRTLHIAERDQRLRLLRAELERLRADGSARWWAPTDDQWRELHRRFGLEPDGDEWGNAVLANSDWLTSEALRRLSEYYARAGLRA